MHFSSFSLPHHHHRLSSPAAGSPPLHPSPPPGVGGHVACGAEGQRAGLRHGGGVCQHRVRDGSRAAECGSEGSAPAGTQSAGRSRCVSAFKNLNKGDLSCEKRVYSHCWKLMMINLPGEDV